MYDYTNTNTTYQDDGIGNRKILNLTYYKLKVYN